MGIEASGCRLFSWRFMKHDAMQFNDIFRKRNRCKQKNLVQVESPCDSFKCVTWTTEVCKSRR